MWSRLSTLSVVLHRCSLRCSITKTGSAVSTAVVDCKWWMWNNCPPKYVLSGHWLHDWAIDCVYWMYWMQKQLMIPVNRPWGRYVTGVYICSLYSILTGCYDNRVRIWRHDGKCEHTMQKIFMLAKVWVPATRWVPNTISQGRGRGKGQRRPGRGKEGVGSNKS